MRNPLFFDQAKTIVIFDGVPAVGLFSGDAVKVTYNAEGSSVEAGVNSRATTFSTDPSGTAEIDFFGTSLTLEKINRMWQNQKNGTPKLFTVQLFTSAAEPVTLTGCSIANPGNIATGGKSASARTVQLNVEKIVAQ